MAVTALFGEVKPLPGSCNFENGSLGDWYTLGAGVAKKGFTVTNTPQVKGAKLQGYYAVIDGMQANKQAVEGYLYSPVYRLSNPSPEIEVGCQYMLASKDGDDASLTLEYRLDDDPWTDTGVDYSNSTPDWQSANIQESDLAGKQFLQVRWHYTASKSTFYALLDNVAVVEKQPGAARTVTYVAVPAEGGTFEVDGLPATSQSVELGNEPKTVVAKPNPGFEFVRWDDSSTNPAFTSSAYIYEDATVQGYFRRAGEVTISYVALPAEGGHFSIGGQSASQQTIAKNTDAQPVRAVPAENYQFVRWLDNGSTTLERAMTAVPRDTVLTAEFVRQYRYGVVVKVTDGVFPLQGATVTVDSTTVQTDSVGMAQFQNLTEGKHPYTVVLSGFTPFSGTLEVTPTIRQENVVLSRLSAVTLLVSCQGEVVPDATVTLGTQKSNTDAEGKITFHLANGTYHFTVAKKGYAVATGDVEVKGQPVYKQVELVKNSPNAVGSSELNEVVPCPNPFSTVLTLTNARGVRTIRVLNALGQTIIRTHAGGTTVTIPTADFPSGCYYLHLEDA